MSSGGTYGDPDAPTSGNSGIYVSQKESSPPPQQPQHPDPDFAMREKIQQLQQSTELMGPDAPASHAMAVMHGPHQPFQRPIRPTHSPQHMAQSAQSVMSLEEHNAFGEHDSATRKRSKVSRACDECRRKKIRCDATSENGPEACSSCKRTGARCQFSRQPMKRGPSKGYIKELADRLNSLEHQIQQPQGPNFDFGGVNDPSLEAPAPQVPRKRTHSLSGGYQEPYGRTSWSGQDRGTDAAYDHLVLTMLTTQEQALNGSAHHGRRVSFGEMAMSESLVIGSNEATVKTYYHIIHPTLCILPHDSSSLDRLTHCPAKLREAFFATLECCVRSFAPRSLAPLPDVTNSQLLQQGFQFVDAAKFTLGDPDSLRQMYNNLVYCQSLLLLALASDHPSTGPGGSTAELLGRIAGMTTDIGLNDTKLLTILREQDHDVYETARRVFWMAFIVDRFHASSRSKDMILPLFVGSVSRDDFNALGETGYHLARAADILGQVIHISRTSSVPNLDPSSPFAFIALTATSPMAVYLHGQLTRFQESLDISNLIESSPPHLTYQYLRTLAARLSDRRSPAEILTLSKDLLGNLQNAAITPLHPIFASLVATSLADHSGVEGQVDVHAAIKDMSDSLASGRIVHKSLDGLGWDTAIRDMLYNVKRPSTATLTLSEVHANPVLGANMAGLQHLAAAAVGERLDGIDTRPVSSADNRPSSSQLNHSVNSNTSNNKVEHDLQAAISAANEAAKAQATAAAAQEALSSASSGVVGDHGSGVDGVLAKDGFMSAVS